MGSGGARVGGGGFSLKALDFASLKSGGSEVMLVNYVDFGIIKE